MGKLHNEFVEAFEKEGYYLYDFTALEGDFDAALAGYDDSLYSLRDYFLNGIKAKRNLNLATFFNEKIIEIKQQAFKTGKLNCVFLLYDGFYTRAVIEGLRFEEGFSTFKRVKDLHLYGINFMFTHINAKDWNSALIDNLRELTVKERIKNNLSLQ